MNGNKKQLAKALEGQIDELLGEMTRVLHERGIDGVRVVSFAVGKLGAAPMAMAEGTPCPVRCVVLPDGRVRCEPQC